VGLSINTLAWFKDKLDYQTHIVLPQQQATELINTNASYWGFIDYILQANNLAKLNTVCRSITRHYGYNHFGFAFLYPKGESKFACHHMFESISEWVKHYQENLIFSDPFSEHCIKHSTPLAWKNNKQSSRLLLQTAPDITAAFNGFSVSNILSMPYHGAGGVLGCFRLMCIGNHSLNKKDIQANIAELHLLTAYLMEAARKILCTNHNISQQQATHLTKREQQVLNAIVKGHSAYTISIAMKISENTVLTHTKNIYRKLGVNNRQVAVARAVALGLVDL